MQGHSHLFKYGWTVLAALAFSDYLDRPTVRRGILMGLAVVLVLQGSFYIGFFVGLTFGLWWLGCLALGRIGRAHVAATWAAVLSCLLAGAVFTFPVWAVSRTSLLADAYQGHMQIDAWENGADLWQYFVPPVSKLARDYLADFNGRLRVPKTHFEGQSSLISTVRRLGSVSQMGGRPSRILTRRVSEGPAATTPTQTCGSRNPR